jgi:hypothetical protein
VCDPSIGLGEEFVAGEKRTGVAVRAHAEQDQIKDGESSGVLFGKQTDKLFLVLVRQLVEVIQERFVDGVDLFPWDRNVREESIVAGSEVGVLVVERYDTFVTEEDLPAMRRVLA